MSGERGRGEDKIPTLLDTDWQLYDSDRIAVQSKSAISFSEEKGIDRSVENLTATIVGLLRYLEAVNLPSRRQLRQAER